MKQTLALSVLLSALLAACSSTPTQPAKVETRDTTTTTQAPASDIKDPQKLGVWTKVNGETRQNGNTANMIFDCRHIVWYLSQFFVLEPGDVIVTGTPAGVGLGRKVEPKYLRVGDVVELGIDKLGTQKQTIVACKA